MVTCQVTDVEGSKETIQISAASSSLYGSGSKENVTIKQIKPFFEEENTAECNTALTHLDEANILHNLR